MYRKRLHNKYTVKDYWLLWSTERMDTERLHEEVSTMMKKFSNKQFSFSFNFCFLRKDTKLNKDHDISSKWKKALVIEAKREEKDQIYFILGRIFSTSNNIKVLGTDLRMIPMLNINLPSHIKKNFTPGCESSTLIVKPCLYHNEIDYFDTKLDTVMREIVMNLETLKSFNDKGEAMKKFQNVDYSTWHSCYVVTFPRHLEKEAEDYLSQLPAYLHFVYGDKVLHMLSADGAAQTNFVHYVPSVRNSPKAETSCTTRESNPGH